jgi:sporulation protein YlmC with PRC-barrel domain
MQAMWRLTDLLGRPVMGPDGRELGRVADLAIDHAERFPRVTVVAVRHRRHVTAMPWRDVTHVDSAGVRVGADVGETPSATVYLRRDLLDAQVVDIAGRRVARVGDVALDQDDSELRVIAVDVGLGSILRRLGLRRAAKRAGSEMLGWDGVHFAAGRGHELQLASPAAAVHSLQPAELAELVARLHPDRGAEVLATVPVERATRARRLALHRPRRFPMMRARQRAPS